MSDLKAYRVPHHGKFALSDLSPSDTPAFGKAGAAKLEQHEDALKDLGKRIAKLQRALQAEQKQSLLLVLQGMDTSGKDGTVRGVFAHTTPLGVRIHGFKRPTEDELAHDFLWRCHAVVPAKGEIMVWNRSHYEDVLVPVVNSWIDKDATAKRYAQINDFERLLTENGTTIVKCMLHIDADEQRRRLQDRIDTPEKRWKFDLGDLDVRKQWPQYQKAYDQLLGATSTAHAPWTVIPANDKLHRNLMIATLVRDRLKKMDPSYPDGPEGIEGLKIE